ncbi:MAG: rhodanese-like domain-containing protein [Patescibacteria group bacterium]
MNQTIKIILISAIVGALAGSGATFLFQNNQKTTEQELIKEFYEIENAVYVSPHGLRVKMSKGETDKYILVDLRSPQEYEKEHIVTAINIPAYKDPNTSAYEEKERIVRQFRELPKDKEIIVYCYSMPCMTGRKIGKLLAENGIYVKHLGIGWNEWRYFWNLWNHDGETPTKPKDFIWSGKEPGIPKIQELPSPCGEGELNC